MTKSKNHPLERVLFTNVSLGVRSGTELHIRDLTLSLVKRGIEVAVYSRIQQGDLIDELESEGVELIKNLDDTTFTPDIIHGHHHIETVSAMMRYPQTPAVFVCHDGESWHDRAPLFPRIGRYVAVDQRCNARLLREGVSEENIDVIYNGVDLDRFQSRAKLPDAPTRALLLSHYANHSKLLPVVEQACRQLNLKLDLVGNASGNSVSSPESILPEYDIVFGKARSAMEAMAVGCSVVLVDTKGSGPMVTTRNWDNLLPLNFGRLACSGELTKESLITRIKEYSATEAAAVSQLTREKLSLQSMVQPFHDLYLEILADWSAIKHDPVSEFPHLQKYLSGHFDYQWITDAKHIAMDLDHWRTLAQSVDAQEK